jgi:hypothetical protein
MFQQAKAPAPRQPSHPMEEGQALVYNIEKSELQCEMPINKKLVINKKLI